MLRDSELQELLDRARISDTIYAFCDYCNDSDVDGVVGLFTEDGVMDLGGGATHNGRGELGDMFADRFTLYAASTFHCSGVRLVRYDGRTASTTTYLYGVHDSAHDDRQMHVWGRYRDELRNESGTWRFARRDLIVTGLNLTDLQQVPRRFERRDHPARPARGAAKAGSAAETLAGEPRAAVSVLSATRAPRARPRGEQQ